MTTDKPSVEPLIQEIIQQTTVLIAKLATVDGSRASLKYVAERLFVELARELRRQGISTKVSADMFGMSLRTYQRKITRLGKRAPERGHLLRDAILELVERDGPLTRAQILARFPNDNARLAKALLRDLTATRQLVSSGRGEDVCFRSPPHDDSIAPAQGDSTAPGSDWETAVREHFDALMSTLVGPLATDSSTSRDEPRVAAGVHEH